MSETTTPVADIKEEATRILGAAEADGFPLRLLGGLAIYFQCASAASKEESLEHGDAPGSLLLPGG